jgi:phosphatidylinositol glycan class V
MERRRLDIARLALASRIIVLVAMSLSNAILPDFNPGDDVLQFDLRHLLVENDDNVIDVTSSSLTHRFCLLGDACDAEWMVYERKVVNGGSIANIDDALPLSLLSTTCASSVINEDEVSTLSSSCSSSRTNDSNKKWRRITWLDEAYTIILPAVIKWDAARFLSLSVDPHMRHPRRHHGKTKISEIEEEDLEQDFVTSEMSHAFLPLWPLVLRTMTNLLITMLPSMALPPTYEATTALVAIIINIFAFVIAAVALYDTTYYISKRWELEQRISVIDSDGRGMNYDIHLREEEDVGDAIRQCEDDDDDDDLAALYAARLFCVNPAGVFFTAAYSESLFAMLTFVGHAVVARRHYYAYSYQCEMTNANREQRSARRLFYRRYNWTSYYWAQSTMLWMMASYTRSNGFFMSIWWMLIGLSKCCFRIRHARSKGIDNIVNVAFYLPFHFALACCVAYPVLYHDRMGYNFNCVGQMIRQSTIPAWCEGDDSTKSRFSLYAYVQRKYWNVGLFRYYEMKQIPNFILALPVLVLSYAAVFTWISQSWARYGVASQASTNDKRKNTSFCAVARNVFSWAFVALDASCEDGFLLGSETNASSSSSLSDETRALLGPKLLSHYAILAGFALVGSFLAHVQVSTRLIFSSCPAIYWFLSDLLLVHNDNKKPVDIRKGSFWYTGAISPPLLIYSYFALYNILGVIMHVNWLPWT